MKKVSSSDTTPAKIHAIVVTSNASDILKSISGSSTSKIKQQTIDPSTTTALVFIELPTAQEAMPAIDSSVEDKFQYLARQWRRETRHVSSIHERSMNRAYQKIIGMGKSALPFILRDLERSRDHWLWALDIISDENPAEDTDVFDDAVDAWLNWGREHDYL